MHDAALKRARARALLTDTLPYEVPVIFSNDKLFASLVRNRGLYAPPINAIVDRVFGLVDDVTKPYSYNIIKDGRRYTTLGIIHPGIQARASSFYDGFASAILASCSFSEISLRRPAAETSLFSESELSGDKTFRLGIPHIEPSEGSLDVSHVVSFFSYEKYNLLGKFVESEEFKRLEKRFKYLQTLDVSKCFFSIYTHSLAWAVKGRDFSKQTKTAFSFEAAFDQLMQSANSGETNGIVIGPELSRVFAEIIFQDIDKSLLTDLTPARNNRDFAIRRYVDDFFVFTNSVDESERITESIVKRLESYKLSLNCNKQKLSTRPFVSGISLARAEISDIISAIYEITEEIISTEDVVIIVSKARFLKARTVLMRQACSKYGVDLHVVSGWLLTNLRNVLAKIVRSASSAPVTLSSALYAALSAVLDIIFYVCAVDLRVRSTYALCQCLSVASRLKGTSSSDLYDRVSHFVSEELAVLVRNALALGPERGCGVEMSNLLISGYQYLGPSFLKNDACVDAIDLMTHSPGISYFRYITVKFCCYREIEQSDKLDVINEKAIARVGTDSGLLRRDSEAYLLFCDLLSSPDLSLPAKGKLFRQLLGGNTSNTILEKALQMIGFVDWTGVAIEHTLQRRALRPVYTWS